MRYGLPKITGIPNDVKAFPSQSSVLDEEALMTRVLCDYQIAKPISCLFYDRGDSDIYQIKTSVSYYYLKAYRPPYTQNQVETEAKYVATLAEAGIPVVRPVSRIDHTYSSTVTAAEGERPILLFEEAPPPLGDNLDNGFLSQLGARVANLHKTSDAVAHKFDVHDFDISRTLNEAIYYTGKYLCDEDKMYFDEIVVMLSQRLHQLSRNSPDYGICHADLVFSNIRQSSQGVITLFDFGNMCKIWRSFELAIIHGMIKGRHQESFKEAWCAFLEGYESIRPLPRDLSSDLPLMLVLRQIMFLRGNCATLPLRRGSLSIDSGFSKTGMERLRALVEATDFPTT